MSKLTIDFKDLFDSCPQCEQTFMVSRGSVYDEGTGVSIYIAAMHDCGAGRTAHVAIAVKEGYEAFTETCSVALQIVARKTNFEMTLVDPDNSPWKDVDYLGRILSRDNVLGGSLRNTFFHIADHIITENPTIKAYLTEANLR